MPAVTLQVDTVDAKLTVTQQLQFRNRFDDLFRDVLFSGTLSNLASQAAFFIGTAL